MGAKLKYTMRAHYKSYAQYKYAVEMNYDTVIPQEIRAWLLVKDSPFDSTHITYINKAIKRYVIAFEYSDDAYYFIAWMEQVGAAYLE